MKLWLDYIKCFICVLNQIFPATFKEFKKCGKNDEITSLLGNMILKNVYLW